MRAFSGISIHAPHEGERHHSQKHDKSENPISIHAPHEGERRGNAALKERKNDFNPRSPRGGATRSFLHHQTAFMNFNPRSPRGGATYGVTRDDGAFGISIHAPHEGERRPGHRTASLWSGYFNPRSPRGGATTSPVDAYCSIDIFQSTLPTRGSDLGYDMQGNIGQLDFNPRSPRGGATHTVSACTARGHISIHAPHEGERR